MKKYEEFHEIPHALSVIAIFGAAAKAGFEMPTLCVSRGLFGDAMTLREYININIEIDDDLAHSEWYVEWDGKRFGSIGC